ncbi:hypothetical protein QUV16_22690, partial [Xanthomonas citri pv. citri]
MKFSTAAAMAATMYAMLCAPAFAGEKANVPVTLQTNSSGQVVRAFGMAGTARNSADTKQAIGCFISAAGSSLQAGCEAQDAAGATTMCFSANAGIVA